MNKKFWLTLLVLLVFMFTIQMFYNIWFAGHEDKDVIENIEKAEEDISKLIETLEVTGSTIDSAITGIARGKQEISILSKRATESDSLYNASLKHADDKLEELRTSFEMRKAEIETLKEELKKLK